MAITERFEAKVLANNDDDKRGRIKVACPELTTDAESELPDWIEPVFEWGWFIVPDVDEIVEIEVVTATAEDEFPGQSMIFDPVIRWRGKRFYSTSETQPRPVPEDFTSKNYGKRRGFATPNGHILFFDDTEESEQINLTWHQLKKDGTEGFCYLSFDKDGAVIVANKNGSMLHLDSAGGGLKLIDENGNLYASDATGLKIIDKSGNVIEMKSGAISVLCGGTVQVNAKTAQLNCGQVDLGDGADSPAVRGSDWKSWAEAHTHATGTGPSGPPNEPILPAVLSTIVKVK